MTACQLRQDTDWNAKVRAHRGPQDFAIEWVDAAGREQDLIDAGGGGRAQERAGIARILHAVQI